MLIPLSQLKKQFAKKISVEQIFSSLEKIGIEINDSVNKQKTFSKVVSALIKKTSPHPNADNLTVAEVFDGNDSYQIICGAKNCLPNIKVALALSGAKLPYNQGMTVKNTKIRGVSSYGMLCSKEELGLPFSSNDIGIIELDDSIPLGEDLSFILEDVVLDISVTPNLGHCLSLEGLAREISLITGLPLNNTKNFPLKESSNAQGLTLQINPVDACPIYSYRIVTNIDNTKSLPDEITNILKQAQIPSINPILDILNFVRLETGQPVLGFDLNCIKSSEIFLKYSTENDFFQLKENTKIPLPKEVLILSSKSSPISIAGIINSFETRVSTQTQSIFLESAFFTPKVVRHNIKKTGLQSEASYHFSRGIDPEKVVYSLDFASSLIEQYLNGISSHLFLYNSREINKKILTVDLEYVNKLLGSDYSNKDIESKLNNLGFITENISTKNISVEIPSYRHDINEPVDLVEEIFRLSPFHFSKEGALSKLNRNENPKTNSFYFNNHITSLMLKEHCYELYTCDLIGDKEEEVVLKTFSKADLIYLKNPGISGKHLLRPSLLPNLLKILSWNIDHGTPSLRGFEIGKNYKQLKEHFVETYFLGILISGSPPSSWENSSSKTYKFFDLKGILDKLISSLSIQGSIDFLPSSSSFFCPGQQASLIINKKEIGTLGSVHPDILKKEKIEQPTFFGEFNLSLLQQFSSFNKNFSFLSVFPSSYRDWTITVPKDLSFSTIKKKILNKKIKWLENVSLISIFSNNDTKKNICLRFMYRNDKKTISSQEVDEDHNFIVSSVLKELEIENLL